jgi:Protein of unknown function (DUF3617)
MRLLFAISIVGLIGAAPALAAEMPARKPGLWEIKMTFENRNVPKRTLKQCIEGSDNLMQTGAASFAQSSCSKRDVQRSGNTITIESTCTNAGKTTHARVVIDGTLGSAYTMTVKSEGDSVPGGMTSMTIAATWLGPCIVGH